MSNTLNLGNGNWATKEDALLGYNSENNNFKPLPFDFERGSTATRVNKEGLIETVGANEPRVDFKDDSKGALLLEPSRTNLINYSEDFSNSSWTKSGSSVVGGFASPSADSPLGAYKLVESTANSAHTITSNTGSVTSGATTTKSIIVKPNGRRWILILDIYKPSSRAWFDLELGVVGSLQPSAISSKIEKLSNGYFRCSVASAVNGTTTQLRMDIVQGDGLTTGYQGDGTSGVYIWGAQLEQGSYSTSIINTQGTAQTRLADECDNGANEQVINSTEGVLYVEMNAFDNASRISLSDGSTSNRVSFKITDDNIDFQYRVGGNYSYRVDVGVDNSNTNKIAMSFNNGVFVGYLNGVAIGSPISGTSLSQGVLDRLNFNDGDSSDSFQGNVKDVRVYNTALTDQELAALTQV